MEYPRLETLSLERKGPVGWLINNRPDQLNAMNALMRDEFELAEPFGAVVVDAHGAEREAGRRQTLVAAMPPGVVAGPSAVESVGCGYLCRAHWQIARSAIC